MWKNPLHIFINSDEDRTSKMEGDINTNRTISIDKFQNYWTYKKPNWCIISKFENMSSLIDWFEGAMINWPCNDQEVS